MEAIAAASSVAGILSLLGQSIDGISKLRGLLLNVSGASRHVSLFLYDINCLLEALHEAKQLVDKLPEDFKDSQITALQIQLDLCTTDVHRLLETAGSLRPASEVGAKAWIKKFWNAVNRDVLRNAREELERHRQAIELSLTVLGRTLDVSAAANIRKLDRKFDTGTAASLSKIEEQNVVLERIESHTKSRVQSSADSVHSLQSIASSLSRIEALAASAASASVSQRSDGLKGKKSKQRSRRRVTGDFVPTYQRGSPRSSWRRSSASAQSLPAVPTIPDTYSHLFENATEAKSRESNAKESTHSWAGMLEDLDQTGDDPFVPENTRSGADWDPQIDVSLHQQYRTFSDLKRQCLTELYPSDVLEYISLNRVMKSYEDKINVLSLLNLGSNYFARSAAKVHFHLCESDLEILKWERTALQERLTALRVVASTSRRRCILAGHSLQGIDDRIRPPDLFKDPNHVSDTSLGPQLERAPRPISNGVLEREVKCEVLDEWSTNRDRINRWLLHCLQSDEEQAQLHKSMLAEPLLRDEDWARQVLRHWYIDAAALGHEVKTSLSIGAVDSHTVDDAPDDEWASLPPVPMQYI